VKHTLTALLVALLAGAVCATPAQADDAKEPWPADPFVDATALMRQSVVAIGTYNRRTRPTVGFFGSGFVVGHGNLAITNAHVVAAVAEKDLIKSLRVYPPNGGPDEARVARVLAQDRAHDLALLEFEGPPMQPVRLDRREPRQGQTVGVLGFPIGMKLGAVPAAHRGVVSAVVPAVLPLPAGQRMTRELAAAIERPYNLYQLDLLVFPGHSGSPVYDGRSGAVVGVINKTLATRTREHLLDQPTAIAYAVPSRWVFRLCLKAGRAPMPTMDEPKGSE